MDKKTFFERFIQALKNIKEEQELDNIHDALLFWCGVNIYGLDSDDVKERIVKDCHAEGVDSIFVNREDRKISFIQAKSTEIFENTNNSLPENELKLTLQGIRFLIAGDYKGKITPKLENFMKEYHELDKTGDYKIQVTFITLGNECKDKKFIQDFNREFPQIEVNFLDFDKIYDFYVNKYLFMTAAPPKRISVEVLSLILKKDTPVNARVFTCRGKDLARLYEEYGESIFQKNVRNLLGTKSKSINSQIVDTASTERSKNFWYFNNGITMICTKINEPTGGKNLVLDSPQIINGAQTTYALHRSLLSGALKDDVEIIMKVIETNMPEFMDCVTLYTNSQNAIKLRDLCSNDPIQIKTQKIFLDTYNLFYERKRGEFEVSYPTEESKKAKFGEGYKIKPLSNEKLAQARLAFYLNKPAEAKGGKNRIFMKEEGGFYKMVFDEDETLLSEKFILSINLLKFIETAIQEYNKRYKLAEEKTESERIEIYSWDFLLHSEYFLLNLFRDFLINEYPDFDTKERLINLNQKVICLDNNIKEIYTKIINALREFVLARKNVDAKYYHTKFFKNDQSIALVRSFFKANYPFVEELT
ncbi:MAG: AIPR family protein [Candidatus Pacearchaeota archaeon]|jgi:hypothetical protein